MDALLPKKLASYIHETGLRALDHLAESPEPAAPDALQSLLAGWRTMTPEEKDAFVGRVAVSVGEVIAASALLPAGIKTGKKAVKSAKKVLKKSAKTLKKSAKAAKKGAKAKAAKKPVKSARKPRAKKKTVKRPPLSS